MMWAIFSDIVNLSLLVLSGLSFVPQIRLIRRRRDCDGISLLAITLNLCIATDTLTILAYATAVESIDNGLSHHPLWVEDWLNLGQFTVAWLGHFVLFWHALVLPPARPNHKAFLAVGYLCFAILTFGPTMLGYFIPEDERDIYTALFLGILMFILAPCIQLFGFVAAVRQAHKTASRGSPGALSRKGLILQAVVFALVGISFLFRLKMPDEYWHPHFIVGLRDWYWHVGWAAINNLIFAAAQGFLAWFVGQFKIVDDGEREPLLLPRQGAENLEDVER